MTYEELKKAYEESQKRCSELEQEIAEKDKVIENKDLRIEHLTELVLKRNKMLFGQKSEIRKFICDGQMLFKDDVGKIFAVSKAQNFDDAMRIAEAALSGHVVQDKSYGYAYYGFRNLYVLGMNNITAFDSCMNEKWISENIAIDGVTFNKTEGYTMVVSCEMDPPDGWITKRISLSDGKLI